MRESQSNVERSSLLNLCNPHHLNLFAIYERHNQSQGANKVQHA